MVELGMKASVRLHIPCRLLCIPCFSLKSVSEMLTKNDILSFDDILLLPVTKRGVHNKTPGLSFQPLGVAAEVTPQR